jgi:hypothetical protein
VLSRSPGYPRQMGLERLIAWHIRTYGMWAYRHEPWSFAIYPLLAALGPLVVWLSIGLRPALWFLAITETGMLVMGAVAVRRRKNLRRSSTG